MKQLTSIIALCLLAFAIGCVSRKLPSSSRVVGGGAQIEWQSHQTGTVILVERVTGKVVATKSLMAGGDPFTFDFSTPVDTEVVKKALGSIPTNAEFILYFAPAPPQE